MDVKQDVHRIGDVTERWERVSATSSVDDVPRTYVKLWLGAWNGPKGRWRLKNIHVVQDQETYHINSVTEYWERVPETTDAPSAQSASG